jgi:hypothetical protein
MIVSFKEMRGFFYEFQATFVCKSFFVIGSLLSKASSFTSLRSGSVSGDLFLL